MLRGNSFVSKRSYNPLTTYRSKVVGWFGTTYSLWEGDASLSLLSSFSLRPLATCSTHPFLADAIGVRSHSLPIVLLSNLLVSHKKGIGGS